MNSPTKTFKRLGIVGAAAVVGLVPIGVLSTSAYAVSVSPTNSLSLASTVPGQTTSATNTFTVTNAFTGTAPETLTITPNGGESLPNSPVDYSVTVGGTADTLTAASSTPGGTASPAMLDLTTAAGAGQVVVVTITGVVNPTPGPNSVFFTDQASSDSAMSPLNTNTVTVAGAASVAATVTSVNPQAFAAGTEGAAGTTPAGFTPPSLPAADTPYATTITGQQFTVMGSGFSTTGTGPTVCFVPSPGTIPSSCTGTGVVAVANTISTTVTTPSTYRLDVVSSTELQGVVSGLTAGDQYNVVVFNSGAAASATSANTLVAASGNTNTVPTAGALNFVPESGVRVVDSRVGLGLPASALTPGVAYYVPAATFENSAAVPTNVPSNAQAVALNVTATAPASAGNLQVWAPVNAGANNCVANSDAAATVNFQPPQDTNNSTVLALQQGVCVQDNGASVNVVMDVTGYTTTTTGANPQTPAAEAFLAPDSFRTGNTGAMSGQYGGRILDTRPGSTDAIPGIQGPLAGGTVYRFNAVAGSADSTLPLAAGDVVVLNVTAAGPTSVGNLRVFPEPTTGAANTPAPPAPSGVPNTAAVTYIPGVDGGSSVVTTVGADGYIDLYSDSAGTVNVVIDEVGVAQPNSSVTGITPVRVTDTRPGGVLAGGTTSFTAVPFAALPTSIPPNALGVLGTLTDIQPTSPGYLVAYPGGETMPGTASIANFPGQTRSTAIAAAVNPANGQVSVSSVGASTNFTFDATAYVS